MLSDEEKKALERIDYIQDFIIENGQYNADVNDMQYFSKVLNIIEKKSKEIEELINEVMEKELIIDGMKEDRRIAVEEIQEQYFVSKEESEQKEKKAWIEGTNVADRLCNKKWKDKIKAKIEYYEKIDNPVGKRVLQSLLEKE